MHAARAQPGEMPLADQQPGRRGLLLLRERASQRIALLPRARAHCISVGRSAAQQRGCVSIPPQPRRQETRFIQSTSSAATTMFAVLRGRALSRLEIDDQLEFHGLLDWQAWMLDPAEFGGGCLRNLGPHGFDMFLPRGRRSSAVTWPKDECADEFFREPRD